MALQMNSREQDIELVDRARQGDADAFDALAAAHREGLHAFVRTRLGSKLRAATEVDDILQECTRPADRPRTS